MTDVSEARVPLDDSSFVCEAASEHDSLCDELFNAQKALAEMAEWIVGPAHDMSIPYLELPKEEVFLTWYNRHIKTVNKALNT